MRQIQEAHAANQLEENQCKTSKDFMEKVMYRVPLNMLYKVVASCQYNEKGIFCPVLIQVVNEEILKQLDKFEFLLQVWSIKGDLLFERRLRVPVSNWNISDNFFIFVSNSN